MSARAVLYKALCHADQMPANDFAKAMIEALLAADYRILGPGELDAETVERCAQIAEKEGVHPELNVFGGGPEWYRHGKRIAKEIRSLAGSKDKEGRT